MALCYSMAMKMSQYQKQIRDKQKEKAIELYKKGQTTREVGRALGKSHTWAWNVVRKMSTVPITDKS